MAWKKARVKFDKKFYKIMCMMVSEEKYKKYMCVIISRNPMINKHSANLMYVVNVKSDIRDKTLTIPSVIMQAQNADVPCCLQMRSWNNNLRCIRNSTKTLAMSA